MHRDWVVIDIAVGILNVALAVDALRHGHPWMAAFNGACATACLCAAAWWAKRDKKDRVRREVG